MFVFDPVLGRIENPNDFLAAANNNQEHLKVEFPTGDPELAGNPGFVDGQPVGGFWRVYYNHFYSNRGHNDVFDGDSGRWNQPGQLVLDCRYNHFHGPAGDEHIDPGGDVYVGSNIFEAGHKDPWGTDFRYSSAISSGDRGTGTTIMVARNLFFDLDHNLISDIADPVIGPNHPGGLFSGTYGPNTQGLPGFVDPDNKNYTLRPDSPARGTAPGGFDYGYTIPEWAYIAGGPSGHTLATTARFRIGGPGLVAYKWRLNGGAWSAPVAIGNGGNFPRGTPAVRQAQLEFSSLATGPQVLEVLGQDMAGNWRDSDPARTVEGLPQAAPTTRTWAVYPPALRLSDDDSDGLPALTEIALGRDPSSPETGGSLPTPATSGTGQPGMAFPVPVNDAVVDGHGSDEVTYVASASDDLTTWTTVALKAPTATWTGSATVETGTPRDGLVTIGVFAPSAERRRFLRLSFVHTP